MYAVEFLSQRRSGYASKCVRLDRRFHVSSGVLKEEIEISRDDCHRAATVRKTHQRLMNWSRLILGTEDRPNLLSNRIPIACLSFKSSLKHT